MSTTDSFGYWLRRRRKAHDLTQRKLADLVGCTEAMIRRIEADERRPSDQLADRIADALAVPTAERDAFLKAARRVGRVDRLDLAVLPAGPPPALAPPPAPAHAHGLPAPPNLLIGRAAEVAAVWALLMRPETRLVSLTGVGGTGKTRLALQVAAELLDQFPDGVCLVDLNPVSDPALALSAIATSLGLREQAGLSAHELLVAYLPGRHLLVLDNFEQILAAGPALAALLAALPGLKLLVTSRFPLRLHVEQEYPVPPLGLPARADEDAPETITQAEAVQLFVARAARFNLALNPAGLRAVAAICRALDGLPLAIELAAAWTRIFTPAALLAHLTQPLELLVGGPRDAPDRQKTLRATIDWSYRLLGPDAQVLFCRLGVCRGGWTLETAEALAADVIEPGPPVLLVLRALAEGQMILAREGHDGEPRFAMLETLREYALDRLRAGDELAAARCRHAEHFADLAERAEPHLHSFESRRWMDRLEADWDNLRAALRWSRETSGSAALGLALIGASWWFWELRGHRREGREWIDALLADPTTATPTPERARALFGAAYMADNEGEHGYSDRILDELERIGQQLGDPRIEALLLYERGSITRTRLDPRVQIGLLERSLAIFRQIGDQLGEAWALWDLGFISDPTVAELHLQAALKLARVIGDANTITMSLFKLGENALGHGEIDRAESLLTEAVAAGLAGGDLRTAAHSIAGLGMVALARGDFVSAEGYFREVLAPARRLGELVTTAQALSGLALVAYWRGDEPASEQLVVEALANPLILHGRPLQIAWLTRLRGLLAEQRGDLARADELLHDSLDRYRALDDSGGSARALASIGHLRQRAGDHEGAGAAFRESLLHPELGPFGVASCLVGMAILAEAQGDDIRAARLWGAAEALGAGSRPDILTCRPDDGPRVAAARARTTTPTLATAWAAGAALTSAEAVAEALGAH